MTSTFSWVDFEEKDRQRMLEVIKMFQENDTRDELGIGTVRDTFSEMFFPGTNTIQTRVKYMLFIPWIYLRHEKKKTPSEKFGRRIWEDEVALIRALLQSDDTLGVIGSTSGERLQRMPSSVYWYGLGRWGIRQFSGSSEELYRYMDSYYTAKKNVVKDDDNEPVSGMVQDNWHLGLPSESDGFPYKADFKLNREEAEYLVDRVLNKCQNTLLAYLVSEGCQTKVKYIWEHPDFGSFPKLLREQIVHARDFALSVNGAALLYNLMLAERIRNEERVAHYRQELTVWGEKMDQILFRGWDLKAFWDLVEAKGRIPVRTRQFIMDWYDLACGRGVRHTVSENKAARDLIAARERRLKGSRARLENQRALEMWSGAAGTRTLTYRWEIARDMVNDILAGLKEG